MYRYLPQEHFSPRDPERYDCYTPSVPLRLLSDAAEILGHTPDTRLDIHPRYRQHATEGAGSDLLHEIVDQTVKGANNLRAPKFKAMAADAESCYRSEARLLRAVRHPEYSVGKEQSVRIVVDEEGDPLLVQKNVDHRIEGVSLALSLRPLNIGEVTWAAGMLLAVKSPHRVENAQPVTIIGQEQVARLGVLRASLFALPAAERLFLGNDGRFVETNARLIGSVTMEEMRNHVRTLMSLRSPLEKNY